MNNRNREKDVTGKKKGILEEHTIGYYRRVSEMIKQGFESDEDKALFLNNVFKQLSDEALKVSQNQTASGIVEELIRSASSEQLVLIMESFSRDWETACCDRFASHVTQAMILRSGQLMHEGNPDTSDENTTTNETLMELFDCLYTFLCASIALYMQHIYASHIVRVLLEVLSGRPVSDSIIRSRLSANQHNKHMSKSVQELPTPSTGHIGKLRALCRKIVKLQKLDDHVQHNLSNPVLQTVLLSVASLDSKKSASLLKKFAKNAKLFETVEADNNEQQLPENVVSEIGSHLVEQYLVVISDEQFDRIYQQFLRGKSLDMAQHPIANFVLQKLISQTRTKEQFEEIHDELSGNFEQILAMNHVGVLIRLAEGCVKHGTKQKKFVKELQKAFHCYHPVDRQKKLIPLLASLSTYEVYYKLPDDSSSSTCDGKEATPTTEAAATESVVKGFNLHGSLLTQSMLKFGNSHPVVDSLLELSPVELCSVCCDASGSRVIEALVVSESVGAAGRERLLNCLTKMFYTLACDKWGSRTFDAVWNAATIEQRKRIASELSARADALRANRFGAFIHERCALRIFKSRPDEWKQFQSGEMKKRKMLQELIGDAVEQTTDGAAKKRKTPVAR